MLPGSPWKPGETQIWNPRNHREWARGIARPRWTVHCYEPGSPSESTGRQQRPAYLFCSLLYLEWKKKPSGFCSLQTIHQREEGCPGFEGRTHLVCMFPSLCWPTEQAARPQGVSPTASTGQPSQGSPNPKAFQQSYIWLGIWNSQPLLTPGKISSILVTLKSEDELYLSVQ